MNKVSHIKSWNSPLPGNKTVISKRIIFMIAPAKLGFYWFRRRLRLRLCCSPAQPTHRMPCTGSYDPAGFQPTLHN